MRKQTTSACAQVSRQPTCWRARCSRRRRPAAGRQRRRRRHLARHAGRQRDAGGPAAHVARRLRQTDVHPLQRRRLGQGAHGGRGRRQSECGCRHARARRRLRFRADGAGWRPLQRRRVPALHLAVHLRQLPGAGRRQDPERRVRPRRPDPGAGAAGLEVRLLAIRLPDADLRADGQLSDRPAGQHRAELLDLRSDRRRGLQQHPIGPHRGRAPGLCDQHREQRHQLQERQHHAPRHGGAADRSARFRPGQHRRSRPGTSSSSPATAAPARRWAASRAAPPASGRCWATSSRSAARSCSSSSSGCPSWTPRTV